MHDTFPDLQTLNNNAIARCDICRKLRTKLAHHKGPCLLQFLKVRPQTLNYLQIGHQTTQILRIYILVLRIHSFHKPILPIKAI